MKKFLALLLALSMVFALAACGQPTQAPATKAPAAEAPAAEAPAEEAVEPEFVLRIAHAHALDSMTGQCMTKMGDMITEYSGGRIACEYYPNGMLGDKIANMEGLRTGTVDMTECAATDMSAFKSRWSAFALPFMYASAEEALKVFTNPDVIALLDKDCQEVGMKLVSMQNVGSRSLVNSKHPINEPDDCKGLKIRSLQDKYIARGMELMGFGVVALGWTEVYPALQQGTIDGADNSAPFIADGKFYEVCKYYSITEAVRLPDPILMSKGFYDSLPADLQEAVDQAGLDYMEWQWDFYKEYEQQSIDLLLENGVEINDITPENRQKFLEVTAPVYEELFEEFPDAKELYEVFEAAKK